jgi:hypothetical protein
MRGQNRFNDNLRKHHRDLFRGNSRRLEILEMVTPETVFSNDT